MKDADNDEDGGQQLAYCEAPRVALIAVGDGGAGTGQSQTGRARRAAWRQAGRQVSSGVVNHSVT